jgi:pimeloyl-ACP methyl ester carboxylesterase
MTQAVLFQPEKSTIDRFNTLATTQLIGAARAVVPQLLERWAFQRFMTPRRRELPVKDGALLARARAFDVALPESGRVAAWAWGEGPAVVLVHGWEGRASQLGAFVDPLVRSGFSVVAFDAPAHGESPGTRASLRTFAEATREVAARVGPIEAMIGHSLGGLAVLLALKNGVFAQSAVLLAPPSPQTHFSAFGRYLGFGPAELSRVAELVEREVRLPFANVEGSALAAGLSTAGLVIHDRNDREASFDIGAATAAAWPDAVLHPTEGLGHRRIVRDPKVVSMAVSFVSQNRLDRAESADLRRWLDLNAARLLA